MVNDDEYHQNEQILREKCTLKYPVYIFLMFFFYSRTDKQRNILMLSNVYIYILEILCLFCICHYLTVTNQGQTYLLTW